MGILILDVETKKETHVNKRISKIEKLYKALKEGDRETLGRLMVNDIEWWFHGPPNCQHMMRVLTGESTMEDEFKFEPRNFKEIEEGRVIVEGWEGEEAYWVHVWTVDDKKNNGMITQFREYFNTWLTVRDVTTTITTTATATTGRNNRSNSLISWNKHKNSKQQQQQMMMSPSISIWESELPLKHLMIRSLPGLVLAI